MMKRITILLMLLPMLSMAQDKIAVVQVMGHSLKDWDTEINLDTIDQEKLPRRVSAGLLATVNFSNFIINQNRQFFSSYMKVGADLGGFVDFSVTKHFAIQGRLVFTAEQNRFDDANAKNELWAFGINIPVLFLGRFGNMDEGYLSLGGGPYTHFNFASNIGRKGAPVYALSDNNSGVMTSVYYEFPIGIQVMANYYVSLTDIVSIYKKTAVTSDLQGMYPQRVELGLAYRWRTRPGRSSNH